MFVTCAVCNKRINKSNATKYIIQDWHQKNTFYTHKECEKEFECKNKVYEKNISIKEYLERLSFKPRP